MVWSLWREESGERKENGLRNQESRTKTKEKRGKLKKFMVWGLWREESGKKLVRS